MRIITPNICRECCYCIEEEENDVAMCCRNMIYTPVKLNQAACKHFAGEEQTIEDDYSCII
jgi:hypothetical protein